MTTTRLGRAGLDARLNAYLRLTARHGRETVRFGPLLATFDPASDNPFLNYAIPDDGASPTAREMDAFIAASRARGRRPRLEYAPRAAPRLEGLLRSAGFVVELRPPLMTCAAGEVRSWAAPSGLTLSMVSARDDLIAVAAVQNEAYAEHGLSGEDPERLAGAVALGTVVALVREAATGEAIAAGVYTPPAGGTAEVAGIGVRPAWRRRGLATALTSALAAHAFANGVTLAFLTPGGDTAQRAYERAGFRISGEMLMIGMP